MLNVEFFHSVSCGHCFIMSSRMRKIVEEYPEINVIHRSHPLHWGDKKVKEDFATKEAFQADMERKWTIANRIDDAHRFNVEEMKQADFGVVTARLPMIAIRAGKLAGGDEWDLFDRFQHALYVDVRDVSDEEVIAQIVTDAGIDFGIFLKYYEDPATEAMVKADFERAEQYELETIPALVVEGKHVIQGTKRTDLAIKLLKEAAEAEGISL